MDGHKKKNREVLVFGGAFGGTVVGLADLEVWVLFAEDVGDPETTDVVRQSLCTHESKPILLGYVTKLNSYIISHLYIYFSACILLVLYLYHF